MCIFCNVYVIFYQYAVVYVIWRKTLVFLYCSKIFRTFPSVLKGLLGVGSGGVRYRVFQQSVAITMKLMVEKVLLAVFLVLVVVFFLRVLKHLR